MFVRVGNIQMSEADVESLKFGEEETLVFKRGPFYLQILRRSQ
jgi:hypothetical protein